MPPQIGEFEVLVLMAVLRLDSDGYAPTIREEIERRTRRKVARGAVYVTLMRLESKGFLASRTDGHAEGGGKPRRYYRVSPKGLNAIRRTLTALEQMSEGIPTLRRA